MATPVTPTQGADKTGTTIHRYEVRPTSDSHFSWLRTRMSAERTLMSWLRTAVSMVGFGFTIVQFFERFHDMVGVKSAALPEAPRYLGMMLIGGGTIALVIAVLQYHTLVKYLWSDEYRPIAPARHFLTPTYSASIIMVGIGLFALFAVAARMV
jgi:putative membrane protein